MSDSNSTSVSFPIPYDPNDKRPLPEIIADHCGFKLASQSNEGKQYYAVQDWIRGVAQPVDASKFWHDMKRRHPYLVQVCWKLSYTASDGKKYQRDYADAVGLMAIFHRIGRKTGIVPSILEGTIRQKRKGGIYVFSIKEMPGYYKIGISHDVQRRLDGYNTATPLTIELDYFVEHSEYRTVEKALHRMFENQRVKGEWFLLSDEDIERIGNILADIPNGKPLLPNKSDKQK